METDCPDHPHSDTVKMLRQKPTREKRAPSGKGETLQSGSICVFIDVQYNSYREN